MKPIAHNEQIPDASLPRPATLGRTIGILLLAHLAAGLTVPFILLERIKAPDLLEGAALHAGEMRTAVFLLFAGSAVPIGVASIAFPVLRRFSLGMALWLFGLGVAGFALQATDNGSLLSLLTLSQEYGKADAARVEVLRSLALVVGSARKWAHYSALFVVGSWIFLLYVALYRFRLVPRVLAGLGLLGSLGQIAGVTIRGFLGYPPLTVLAMPLAPAYVALALWLIVKGFDEGHDTQIASG